MNEPVVNDSSAPDQPQEPGALDRMIRFVSEDLARTLDRRSFVKRASTGAFMFMASVATGRLLSNPARASAAGVNRSTPPQPPQPPMTPNCAPPGPYCNNGGGDLSGCNGAHCFDHLNNGQLLQCRVYYAFYAGGCWTASGSGGHWTCCDCECGGGVAHCGCAQFSGSPSPLPFGPGSKGN